MKLKEKKLKSKQIYKCFFMELFEDDVLLPNEKKSKRIYVKHEGAAAVLPITEDNKVVLVKQFRYPINSITIEVPAGKKDSIGEEGLLCAKRELEEETGYQSENIVYFQDFYSCVGYSSEMIELFIAVDCYKVDNPIQCDDDEFIEILELSRAEVKELLLEGKITDSKTLALLQYYVYSGDFFE